MKKLILFSLILSSIGCARYLPPQDKCGFAMNSEHQRVSWNNRLPVRFYIGSDVPEIYHAAIRRAADEYNFKMGRNLIYIPLNTLNKGQVLKDGFSSVHFLYEWPDSQNVQAKTKIFFSGATIVEADIVVNAQDFRFNEDPFKAYFNTLDLMSLMVHEFGHVLGLAHMDTGDSVMHTYLSNGEIRRTLTDEDLLNLRCEY